MQAGHGKEKEDLQVTGRFVPYSLSVLQKQNRVCRELRTEEVSAAWMWSEVLGRRLAF